MYLRSTILVFVLLCTAATLPLQADQPRDPHVGYIYPPGARAGSTIDVQLGGFNWTPDVEILFHNDEVQLELVGKLGPLFLPGAPYFIGTKAYYPPPMPREISGRLTLPASLPPGPIHWQVANANGTSSAGAFVVSQDREVLEQDREVHKNADGNVQRLDSLPVTVSGRLGAHEEIDQYVIRPDHSGPITC